MRQGQQHRRGRSRGGQGNSNNNNNHSQNNNRKGQNPLSRSYQSNGPDGKVSGSASSIAEKYLTLARDAQSSGDPVLAENYLQHAEHYNRIILAYREQISQGEEGSNGGQGRARETEEEGGEEEVHSYGRDMQPLPPMEVRPRQSEQPQPRIFDQDRAPRDDRGARDDRGPRDDRGGNREGMREGNREGGNRQDGNRDGNRQEGGRQEGGRQEGGRFDERQPRLNDGQRRPQRDRFEPRERYGENRDRFGGGERANGNGNGNGPRGDRGDRFGYDRGERPGNVERPSGERSDARPADRPMREPREGGLERAPMAARADLQPPIEGVMPVARTEVPMGGEPMEPAARAPRPPRRERPAPVPAAAGTAEDEQPAFLRRPVRRPRRDASADDAAPPVSGGDEPSEG